MYETVGEIIVAMLGAVRLDLTTGKASKIWDHETFRTRLGVDAARLSHFKSGHRLPSSLEVAVLVNMAKEMGTKGEAFVEPLERLMSRIKTAEAEPRSRCYIIPK